MTNKFYITTPIYYVNDEPHIGHTYTTIIADIIARYYKLLGIDTFFLTGTDEHGAKIFEAATKRNVEPKQYCDNIAEKFKETWRLLGIEYTNFIRTTDDYHTKTVQYVLQKIYDNGDIYKSYYEGLYCIQCERFISEDELVDGVCPDHQTKPLLHKEENYFFNLSKYKNIIFEKIKNEELQILPETRKNEILGKLQQEIQNISISRKTLKWGIPLPFDKEQTVYVWIDALINYLSGIDYFGIKGQNRTKFWPCDLHLIGKDILWFHTVIWPAILLSLKLDLPKKVLAHGFFTVEGKKMSKTLGNVIRPKELVEIFGVDATRLLVVSAFPIGTDGNFSVSELKERYNKSLADNYGNLVQRTIGMLKRYFNNQLKVTSVSNTVKEQIKTAVECYKTCFNNFELHKLPDLIFSLTSFANTYIQEKSPWILAKENKTDQLIQTISDLLYCIKSAALMLYPITPAVSKKVLKTFNEEEFVNEDYKNLINDIFIVIRTQNFSEIEILFKKIK